MSLMDESHLNLRSLLRFTVSHPTFMGQQWCQVYLRACDVIANEQTWHVTNKPHSYMNDL